MAVSAIVAAAQHLRGMESGPKKAARRLRVDRSLHDPGKATRWASCRGYGIGVGVKIEKRTGQDRGAIGGLAETRLLLAQAEPFAFDPRAWIQPHAQHHSGAGTSRVVHFVASEQNRGVGLPQQARKVLRGPGRAGGNQRWRAVALDPPRQVLAANVNRAMAKPAPTTLPQRAQNRRQESIRRVVSIFVTEARLVVGPCVLEVPPFAWGL